VHINDDMVYIYSGRKNIVIDRILITYSHQVSTREVMREGR